MSVGKRWRGLSHQIRVTVISTVASTVVLGLVLLMTGFLLVKNATDADMRQMSMLIDGRLRAERDHDVASVVDRYNRSINRFRARLRELADDGNSGPVGRDNDRHRHPAPGGRPGLGGSRVGVPRPANQVKAPTGTNPPPPRPHMAFLMYGNDGAPFKGAEVPDRFTFNGNPIPWPKQLDGATLPATFLHFERSDLQGRFKYLCVFDATDQITALRRANLALLILWPVLVALLGLASYFAVGSSFRPLHKLLTQAGTLGLNDRLQTADQAEFGELAASLNSYLDRIEKVVRQQEEFAVDAAHELSTPLTALRGQLELALLQKGEPQAYETAARNAINQVSRLTRLVESLLLATRPRDVVVVPVDVQQMLEEIQARWVDRYAARHVDLKLTAGAFKARMPEEELESVMENLLANALKFSPSGTSVAITLDSGGHLVVQDQGPGIPEADRERVFERFERGTTKARGFGIGLYLVRRLLEQRGGAIRIGESTKGARVEVALPA